MESHAEDYESTREGLVQAGLASPTASEALRRYAEAMTRMPPLVMVNTGAVRYSTGGNA